MVFGRRTDPITPWYCWGRPNIPAYLYSIANPRLTKRGGRQEGAQTQDFDNDAGLYLAWLREHPDGYMLNRRRGKSDNYLVLHRAGCQRVQDYNAMARPGGFTARGYIKVCSDSLAELQQWRSFGQQPVAHSIRLLIYLPRAPSSTKVNAVGNRDSARATTWRDARSDPRLPGATAACPKGAGTDLGHYPPCGLIAVGQRATKRVGLDELVGGTYIRQLSPGMTLRMYSSNSGTVNAVSPCCGL